MKVCFLERKICAKENELKQILEAIAQLPNCGDKEPSTV